MIRTEVVPLKNFPKMLFFVSNSTVPYQYCLFEDDIGKGYSKKCYTLKSICMYLSTYVRTWVPLDGHFTIQLSTLILKKKLCFYATNCGQFHDIFHLTFKQKLIAWCNFLIYIVIVHEIYYSQHLMLIDGILIDF